MTYALPPRLLLGLVGRAGAGKSTVARYLVDEHAFEHIALAAPVRAMVGALFHEVGIADAWAEDRVLKETPTALGVSYRVLAQTLGTEWGRRTLRPDFWLLAAAHKLEQARRHGVPVVVSDVRFADEAEWIRRHGGVLVRIQRDRQPDEPAVRPHESEDGWAHIDAQAELLNHTSLGTLETQVEALLDTFRQPSTQEHPAP